ncbi:MAG: hypothetical protein KatS3mg074_623 [Meiothermus sp.]|uniref:DUF4013 domain-containing protein n=2 Tax=Meiothermus hypogaeus TaxID=884155 RepID=A0A511R5G5_9DEIN|nr:hypothetical protein [Meiothermus hypogaeus]RIH78636.1 hypothetical protein Mhypo_01485 [Meiothermus hypogaeus]GEM84497.1 hypothetical protein MHY01S_26630 [Meiothermus hypogaeus NBRC 106114]GIW38225.1 MAG: hypothetical protein KatS3mg074_623 [Meiothermus sp.]
MLDIGRALTRSFGLLAQHPVGIVWLLVQALLVSIFTLGLMAGPMQVGVYTVLMRYARTGQWDPQALWGNTTGHNIVAGIVFVTSALAAFVVGLPVAVPNALLASLLGYLGLAAINLLWFYTFQIMVDDDQTWPKAIRKGWDLMQQGGLLNHLLLIAILESLVLVSTLSTWLPFQVAMYLLLLGFSTVARAVAYVQLVPTRAFEP